MRTTSVDLLAGPLGDAHCAAVLGPGDNHRGVTHEGTVVDTMNGGGYTYVQIKEADTTFWAAGPQTEVSKGDKVAVVEQMWMNEFTSKTLNRTFDKLLFVGQIDKK